VSSSKKVNENISSSAELLLADELLQLWMESGGEVGSLELRLTIVHMACHSVAHADSSRGISYMSRNSCRLCQMK